jgi:hypothetical protein
MTDNVHDFFGRRRGKGDSSGWGGPPTDNALDARVAKLEATSEYTQKDVSSLRETAILLERNNASIVERLAAIETQMKHMPSSLSMWGAVVTVGITVGGGISTVLWFAVEKFVAPILAKAIGA